MTNTDIRTSTANNDGGSIRNASGGTATLDNTIVTDNMALGGGGIHNSGTLSLINGSEIRDNHAVGNGGGLLNRNSAALQNSTVNGNTTNGLGGGSGGGIFNDGGAALTLDNTTLEGNTSATGGGGGLNNNGTATLINGTVLSGNSAPISGGIWNGDPTASLTLDNSTVSGNASTGPGGGIVNDAGATAALTNATVSNNTAASSGGGIQNSLSALSVVDSTFTGNQSGGNGGGISSEGSTATLTLTRTTVSGNTATDDGGGVANRVLGVLTVLNSTISGNIAGDVGGGVMNSTMSVLTVLNSTISDNVAGGAGGGIWHSGATATLKNSIVAGNTAADCDGAVVSIDNNLDSDGTCNLIATRDLSGVDPLLGPLASNGGPTQTRALLLGSPAINAGNDVGAPPTDQRGFPRVGVSDIGAFEFQGLDADGDGFDDIAAGGTDCNDGDATIFPGAAEIPYDGVDQDCDGSDLSDVDGDGVEADQAVGGTPDCDDSDPSISPGTVEVPDDGIDQDCDGSDLISAVAMVQHTLVAGWNTLVFTGGSDPADFAASLGPRVDSLWSYDAALQAWLVHRPGGIDVLNTLATIDQGDALFIHLTAGGAVEVSLPDLLIAGPQSALLLPQWNFVGYTGADAAMADLLTDLPPDVSVAYLYDPEAQEWLVFRRGQPEFLSTFTSVDRLGSLFILKATDSTATLSWEQVGGGGP